jgi:hypothetical protein
MSLIAAVTRRLVMLTVPIALFAGTVATATTPIQADATNWACISFDRARLGPTGGTFPGYGLKAEISVEASGGSGNCTIKYKFSFNLYPPAQGDTDSEGGIGIEDTYMPQGVNLAIEAAPLHLRVWKCGGNPIFDADVLWYHTNNEIWYETQPVNYGGCGPQADDAFSWFITNGYGAGTTYINENGG